MNLKLNEATVRCICDDGFGMNLSCPQHKPHGREFMPTPPVSKQIALPKLSERETSS